MTLLPQVESGMQSTGLIQSILSGALLVAMTVIGLNSYGFFSTIVANQEKILERLSTIDADNKLKIKSNEEFTKTQSEMISLLKDVVTDDVQMLNDYNKVVLGKIDVIKDLRATQGQDKGKK